VGHGNSDGSRVAKIRARESMRHWARPLTMPNPHAAIPDAVLKQLASERLPDKQTYTARLQELLKGTNE
jgi:hypothetical protein